MAAELARIVKQGSLPSMIRWKVAVPGEATFRSTPFRTRAEARAWCDANGIPWRKS